MGMSFTNSAKLPGQRRAAAERSTADLVVFGIADQRVEHVLLVHRQEGRAADLRGGVDAEAVRGGTRAAGTRGGAGLADRRGRHPALRLRPIPNPLRHPRRLRSTARWRSVGP